MSETGKQTQTSSISPIITFWGRIPVLIRAILAGIFVTFAGIGVWLFCLTAVPAPWSVIIMAGVLWLYWKYFSGNWWPRSTADARSKNFRAISLSANNWKWGLAGTLLFLIILESATVLTFRLIEFPAEAADAYAEFGFNTLPLWHVWLIIIMASVVAGICEEVGFRGYIQVPLEERYGPVAGITITSLLFTVLHLNQAWAGPILFQIFAISALFGILAYTTGTLIPSIIGHTIMDILNFAFWWTDIGGDFDIQHISVTGIDPLLIGATTTFVISIALFFWTARKIRATQVGQG